MQIDFFMGVVDNENKFTQVITTSLTLFLLRKQINAINYYF
jgi:hypothetical protein